VTARWQRFRQRGATALLSGLSTLAFAGLAPGISAAATTHRDELIPLYDNATPTDWQTACSQSYGGHGGSYIIADPFSGDGPGSGPAPAWTSVIDKCYRYGRASVIGYVWTNYGNGGTASIPAIEQQVKNWYAYYPGQIAGIFFDGVSDTVPGTTTSNKSFYQTLASYVHTHEGNNDEVVFNFGANPGSDWMLSSGNAKNADIVVTFEGSYNDSGLNPYTQWTQASWELAYPADDFAALIYDAPDAGACTSLAQQHVGYVYVGTWYDVLPPFWNQFLAAC
jgi:Spherulation-specific family 4